MLLYHYSNTSSNSNLQLDHTYSKELPARPGDKVRLLVNSKMVGIGTLGEGNQLHCHQIPPEFVTLSIDEIDDCICPIYLISFDEPFYMWANLLHGQLHSYNVYRHNQL